MDIKELTSKAKDIANNLNERTKHIRESEEFQKGISFLKTKWEILKSKRLKIEDISEETEETEEKATTVEKKVVKKAVKKTKAPVKKTIVKAKKSVTKKASVKKTATTS